MARNLKMSKLIAGLVPLFILFTKSVYAVWPPLRPFATVPWYLLEIPISWTNYVKEGKGIFIVVKIFKLWQLYSHRICYTL